MPCMQCRCDVSILYIIKIRVKRALPFCPCTLLCSFNNIEIVKCSILPKAQSARSRAALASIEVINRCLLASGRLFRLPASGAPSARSINACQPLRGFPPPPSAWLRFRYAITPGGVRGARQSSQSQPGLLCQRLPARALQVGCAHPCLFPLSSPRAHCSHYRPSALAPHFPRLPVPALLPPRRVRPRAPLRAAPFRGGLGGGCPAPRGSLVGVFAFVAGARFRGGGSVLPPPVPPLGGAPSGC